jgi:hypothetical protein
VSPPDGRDRTEIYVEVSLIIIIQFISVIEVRMQVHLCFGVSTCLTLFDYGPLGQGGDKPAIYRVNNEMGTASNGTSASRKFNY